MDSPSAAGSPVKSTHCKKPSPQSIWPEHSLAPASYTVSLCFNVCTAYSRITLALFLTWMARVVSACRAYNNENTIKQQFTIQNIVSFHN